MTNGIITKRRLVLKTEQILKREFYNQTIRQNHKTEFLCMTDMLKVGNMHRKNQGLPRVKITNYMSLKSTKEFIELLMREENVINIIETTGKSTGKEYWANKYLFLDFALWLSPKFKVKVYKWLYDNLTVFRDESGESYKKMAAIIQDKYGASKIGLLISSVAKKIKEHIGVTSWNTATEDQLKERDEIHKRLEMLLIADVDIERAIKLVIERAE